MTGLMDIVQRIEAYRKNLLSIAEQLEEIADMANLDELHNTARLYTLIAKDLQDVVDNKPLQDFTVNVVIPNESE